MEELESNEQHIFEKYSKPITLDVIRHKINNLINLNEYCGICFEGGETMSSLDEDLEIIVHQWTESVSLKDIIDKVFFDNPHILANTTICSKCKTKLLQSYIFIQNTKTVSRIMNIYINNLYNKLVDINFDMTRKAASSNIVIKLENFDVDSNTLMVDGAKGMLNDTVKTTLKKEAIDNTFQCVECNIFLPTFQAWKKHDNNYHTNDNFQCKVCYKSFETQQYLVAHYKVHATVKCKICHQIISDIELISHLQEFHKDTAHICIICNEAFYSSKILKSHMKITHENMIGGNHCVMCPKSFRDDELKGHNCTYNCSECEEILCVHYKYLKFFREQIYSHASTAKCLDCDYVCHKEDNLLQHVNREHLDYHPYTCDECGQQFYSKLLLKSHMYRCHMDIFTCDICDTKFYSKEAHDSHQICCESSTRENTCGQCNVRFDNTEQLMKHKRHRHSKEIFPCGICSKELLTESKRKEHMVKVHSGFKIKNLSMNVQCAICEDKFDTKSELVQHMQKHGPNVMYPCKICNTEYESLRKLRAHSRKHVGPFVVCEICGKEMRKVLLDKHMSNHSSMGEIVTCDTCGKSFLNITQLKYHQKVHLDNVPCPKCKKLINPAKLRRHWRVHMMEEDPKLKEKKKQKAHLKCELCDYMTWNNILLECHMNRHHLKIKPYICHICSKDFIGKHLLRKHIETHSDDKIVNCMICGNSFANSACLKMHLRLHTGETPYPCDICGQRFRSSSIMNVHKQKKHCERRYLCPLCSNKFHTIRDMRRHVIKVHWKQKDKRFDPRELKGLQEEHYHLFHDGRRVKIHEKEVDFFKL